MQTSAYTFQQRPVLRPVQALAQRPDRAEPAGLSRKQLRELVAEMLG